MTQPGSVEGRIAQLEQQVRSLLATNATDRASVVDATGHAVPLSSLAFGLVGATVSGYRSLGGGPGGSGTVNDTDHTPTLAVYVSGGRLRMDWSASLTANTAGGNSAVTAMSAVAQGPYPTAAAALAATPGVVTAGVVGYGSAASLTNDQEGTAGNSTLGAGTFDLWTGLAAGYYLAYCSYSFTWDATNNANAAPAGGPRRRALTATPF